jgi:hypothetical protein
MHTLIVRLTTGQMQFSIPFYNSKFSISLLQALLYLQNLSCVSNSKSFENNI